MSPLGFGVSFILAFAVGVSWLAWAFDARIERSRRVRQIPLPLDYTDSGHRRRPRTRARPVMTLAGFLLILLSVAGAAVLGRLATMQPGEAAAVFIAFPLLRGFGVISWGLAQLSAWSLRYPARIASEMALGQSGVEARLPFDRHYGNGLALKLGLDIEIWTSRCRHASTAATVRLSHGC